MTRRTMEFEVSRDQIQSAYIFSVHKGLIIIIIDCGYQIGFCTFLQPA